MHSVIVSARSLDPLGRVCLLGIAVALIAYVVEYGRIAYGVAFLEKYAPDMTMFGLVKVAFSVTAAFLVFIAAQHVRSQNTLTTTAENSHAIYTALIANAALLVSSAIVISMPEILSAAVGEGHIVSTLTELMLLAAVVIFVICAWRVRGNISKTVFGVRLRFVFISMAVICLVIAMEEMSWGQHWLGWEAGDLFTNNAQNETNMHNFATNRFEAAYYTAAFLTFVVIPAFLSVDLHPKLVDIAPLLPSCSFALAGVPVAGLMFEEWNIQVYQVWFFLAIIVGLWIASTTDSFWIRVISILTSVSLFLSQLVFISLGSAMVEGYELSEIRELLISVLFASYALLMHRRLRLILLGDSV